MLTPDAALDRLQHVISQARRFGADAADAVYVAEASSSIGIRMGELEDVSRSEGEDVGLRVFVGTRAAQVSSSDLSLRALEAAAERAVAMAREAPEDPYAGLAPEELLFHGPHADLDTYDPEAAACSPDRLKQIALEAEDAARAVAGVTNSEGGNASAGEGVMALATSHGFAATSRGSSVGLSASVVAGAGDNMQRDYDWTTSRYVSDLRSPSEVGRTAGERAVKRLNPIKLETGTLPVILDPRIGGSLLSHLLGAISGSSIARGTSFLRDAEGTALFPESLSVIDDPLRPRGLRSRAFDGEGLPTRRTAIIDRGVLTTYLIDSSSGRQLQRSPTGHATRGIGSVGAGATNLHLEGGHGTATELMADIKRGFYVTELIGMGVNQLTGDYSRGAAGFLIEDGVLTVPVSEVTIAGNLKAMFKSLSAADDLQFLHAVNVPTMRIDGMTLAGA